MAKRKAARMAPQEEYLKLFQQANEKFGPADVNNSNP